MRNIVTLVLMFTLLAISPLSAGSVATVDKDELKGMLGSEKLVVLDVRSGRDWSTSEFLIQGAIRVDGKDLSAIEKYPKDNTFVLYCA